MKIGQRYRPHRLFTGVFVPDAIYRHQNLTLGAKLLFGRLAKYEGERGEAYPAVSTLAEELGISNREVVRDLGNLVDEKLIEREPRSGTSTVYHFLWQPCLEGCATDGASGKSCTDADGVGGTPPMAQVVTPPMAHEVSQLKRVTEENHSPLTPQGEFWHLSRDQHLRDPEINYPQIWNDLVPEAPVRWNWAKDKLHKDCADREFKSGFRDLCKKASAIHKARGDKAKWLTFRNLFTKNPQTKIPKWRNLLLGEYDFLLSGFPEEKPKDEVVYKSFEEVFQEQDNPTKKKYPRYIDPYTGEIRED